VPVGARRRNGEDYIKSYTKRYNCMPPPLFIISISVIEVGLYFGLYLAGNQKVNQKAISKKAKCSKMEYQCILFALSPSKFELSIFQGRAATHFRCGGKY